jgi:hypothetical protein
MQFGLQRDGNPGKRLLIPLIHTARSSMTPNSSSMRYGMASGT